MKKVFIALTVCAYFLAACGEKKDEHSNDHGTHDHGDGSHSHEDGDDHHHDEDNHLHEQEEFDVNDTTSAHSHDHTDHTH